MNRPLLWLLGALALIGGTAPNAWSQGTIYTLRTNGPPANRINVVILAEGYTNGQVAKFTNEANAILQSMTTTAPYSAYARYLNVYAIFVASAQAGSDHPSSNLFRNTYFNSTYDSYGIGWLVTIPPNDRDSTYANGEGKVDSLLQILRPDYDIALLLVNDTVYGGSGGRVAIASIHNSSKEIALHEIGHSFADLGDEYTNSFPNFPDIEEPNTTRQTNRLSIKWNAWILPSTPVPTPDIATYDAAVGLFEGAHYHSKGWYRPMRDCKMRNLGVRFCDVCAETIVKSIYDLVTPVDFLSPPTNALVSLTNADRATFALTLPMPTTHRLRVAWYTNEVLRSTGTNASLSLTALDLPPGTNTVRAHVVDATSLVRNDPAELLQEIVTWRVRAIHTEPLLMIQTRDSLVELSWPASAAGFQLQAATDLAQETSWTTILTISNVTSTSVTPDSPHRFFRLRWP